MTDIYWQKFGTGSLLAVALIVGITPGAVAQSELDKYLDGKAYDPDKLLEEIDNRETQQFSPGADVLAGIDTSAIALILPLDAPGFVGEVANAFLEGFVSAAEATGAEFALETYRTDGQPQSGLTAYRQAVLNGAGMIIGPLLRSSVEEITRLPATSTVPTILLQEPARPTFAEQLGAAKLYTFPLGGEVEILQFAKLLEQQEGTWSVYVMIENSDLGRRLEQAWLRTWQPQDRFTIKLNRIYAHDDWQPLHDVVRFDLDYTEEEKDALKDDPELELRELPDNVAVFAAGGGEFASQTRANMPSATPVYVLASSQDGLDQGGRNILVLSGIRFFEMPYVLALRNGSREVVAGAYALPLPLVLQRYVAAGIDAYQIAVSLPSWGRLGIWQHDGVTGQVVLHRARFERAGRLLELTEGTYTDISPQPADADATTDSS